MKLYILIILPLSAWFSLCPADQHMMMKPRLIHPNSGIWSYSLPKEEKMSVFYLSPEKTLYIGGEETLYHFDFKTKEKNYTIAAESYKCREQTYCKNYVTFVGQLLGNLVVCGTNAYNPCCWKMDGEKFEKAEMSWTEQLAPRTPETNYNILITGNQTYSTLHRISNNRAGTMKTIFRKIYGTKPLLYTGDNLMNNPHFVKSLVVEKVNSVQNKIFLFFNEDNSETRTTEKRVSMVAQLCKEESGSVNPGTRNVFSTALKSRLICGNELAGQYYPHLQDVYFLQGKTGNLIYGLFTNAWNHSAVCSYKVEDIEIAFNTSSLFGTSQNNLTIHPGTCLPSPTMTPEETSNEVFNFPELTNWLLPSGKQAVFQTVVHYTKIVVDEIKAVNQDNYRVLLLATDNGTVHKVVEHNDGALNILELCPFSQGGKILHLELEPREHVLYVGTAREVSKLPLDDCTAYNNSCTDCILSRDPYCGWTEGNCQSILINRSSSILQNFTQGAMCKQEKDSSIIDQKGGQVAAVTDIKIPDKTFYFLSCTAVSNQATYCWKNGDKKMEKCTPHDGICYLLFNQVIYPGEYECLAQETATEQYEITVPSNATRIQYNWFVGLAILLLIFTSHSTLYF